MPRDLRYSRAGRASGEFSNRSWYQVTAFSIAAIASWRSLRAGPALASSCNSIPARSASIRKASMKSKCWISRTNVIWSPDARQPKQ